MAVQQWTTNPFEESPQDSQSPGEGAERIRELKETAGSLLDKEHKARDTGNITIQGWHRPGSAITYYTDTEPTTRPDETTALDASDAGRLWVDSGDGMLDYWDGSAWQDVITDQSLKTTDDVTFGTITAGGDISAGANSMIANSMTAVTIGSGVGTLTPLLATGGRIAGYYTGATTGTTGLPIGSVIIANGLGDIPNRNSIADVKQAGTGAFNIASDGTQMVGTWRARGGVITGTGYSVVLMQRTL